MSTRMSDTICTPNKHGILGCLLAVSMENCLSRYPSSTKIGENTGKYISTISKKNRLDNLYHYKINGNSSNLSRL